MPLLKRLFWPLLVLPSLAAAAIIYLGVRAKVPPAWLVGGLLLPVLFGGLYAFMLRVYQVWSAPPAAPLVRGSLVTPEAVLLVSRGGYLTPGCAFFTDEQLVFFAAGRRLLSLPFDHVARVELAYGKVLGTPYVDFFASDGRKLGRLAAESAPSWAPAMQQLCLRRGG